MSTAKVLLCILCLALVLYCAVMLVWFEIGRDYRLARDHDVILAADLGTLRGLLMSRPDETEALMAALISSGAVRVLQPGLRVRLIEHRRSLSAELSRQRSDVSGKAMEVAVDKIRILEGPHAGSEGWVLSVDVGFARVML